MSLFGYFQTEFCIRLSRTLMHFLWQGMVISLFAVLAAVLLRRGSSRARYGVYVVALLLMALCPPVTFWIVGNSEAQAYREEPEAIAPRTAPIEAVLPETGEVMSLDAPHPRLEAGKRWKPAVSLRQAGAVSAERRALLRWRRYAPHAAACYLVGVTFMLARLLVALHGGKELRRRAQPVEDSSLTRAMARWAKALGLSLTPAIAYCRRVAVPTVVGVLRPMILLPLAVARGLTPEQVEMSLLHELAHIRRYDHLVNIVQGVIEAVLFFHPGVWFLSRRIRIERENCCDDMVVALGAKPVTYASSLVEMAALGRPRERAGLATASLHATRKPSQLRRRVLRLLGDKAHEHVRLRGGWAIALPIVAAIAIGGAACLKGQEEPAKQSNTKETPETGGAYTATLSSGIKVELVGISYNPSRDKPWWKPDGSPLSERPYDTLGAIIDLPAHQAREFAIRLTNLLEGNVSLKWGAGSHGFWRAWKDGKLVANLWAFAGMIPDTAEKADARIGVAAGPWKTFLKTDNNGQRRSSSDGHGVTFDIPQEIGNEVRLAVTDTLLDRDRRIIAIDLAGQIHKPSHSSVTFLSGTRMTDVGFDTLRLDQLKEFRFQTRPYEWAEFKDVALWPDEPAVAEVGARAPDEAPQADDLSRIPESLWGLWLPNYDRNREPFGTLILLDIKKVEHDMEINPHSAHVSLRKHGLPPSATAEHLSQTANQGHLYLAEANVLKTLRATRMARLTLPSDPRYRHWTFVDQIKHMTKRQLVEQIESYQRTHPGEQGRRFEIQKGETYGLILPDGRLLAAYISGLELDTSNRPGVSLSFLPIGTLAKESLSLLSSSTAESKPEYRVEGELKFDEEIPLDLRLGKKVIGDGDYFAVQIEWARFFKTGDYVEASLAVKTASVLSAKWRITVELLTADGRGLADSEAVFATLLAIIKIPELRSGFLHFSFGLRAGLPEAKRFRISAERAPDDAKVTADLTRNRGPVGSSAAPAEKPRPFIVTGMVTDEARRPMPGVEVWASCGRGSLLPTGNAVSGADGKYTLRFGPGYGSLDKESGEWDFPYQFAVVGALKPGYYEKNLSRQGALSIAKDAHSVPEGRREPVLFPNQPYQLDFVMLPAATIKGRMVDLEGRPVASQRFVVDGEELLPAASVLRNVTTDEDGRFTVSEVPCKPYWFALVAARSREIKTAAVEFSQPGTYEIELLYDADKPSLEVKANHSLEVGVVDNQGKPAGVVLIQLWRAREPEAGPNQDRDDWREPIFWHDRATGKTWVPDGLHQTRDSTVFEKLLPGEYRVSVARVREGGGSDPSPVGVSDVIRLTSDRKTVTLTVRLEGDTALTLKFFDDDKKTLENAHFVLLRSDGFPVGHGRLFSGTSGTFRFGGLTPGTHSLKAGKRAWQYGQTEYRIPEESMRIEVVRGTDNILEVPLQPVELTRAEIEERWPFVVTGTVTDQEGQVMPGVEVRVHCGMGTLWPTGKALSGADGKYTLRFGAAMTSLDEESGKWIISWQFATVRAYKAGYCEKNLSRHGGLSIAGEARLVPKEPREPVVLPNQPYRLDFVMLPAATIKGRIVDDSGQPIANQKVWLSGKELPPSQSVLAGAETDKDGRFTIGEVPCKSWWFALRDKKGRELKTDPVEIPSTGTFEVELTYRTPLFGQPTLTCRLIEVHPDAEPRE